MCNLDGVGDWYSIGILVGAGAAIGVAAVAILLRLVPALLVAAAVSAALGFVIFGWQQAIGGAVGAACGALGAAPLATGSLRRGGTRGGTAILLVGAAVVLAALAFVPVLGYLEAVAVLVFGLRLRRRAPDRHAGLRTLARD
jgi:hypothetical protein